MDPLFARLLTLVVGGFVMGLLAVAVAHLSGALFAKSLPGNRRTRMIAGLGVNALLALSVAALWQYKMPIMFEHVFGWNNFRHLTSPTGLAMGLFYTSFGPLLAFALGAMTGYTFTSRAKAAPQVVAGFVLAFVAAWWFQTETLPRGVEATVEVRLWYSHDDASWHNDIDQFYQWAGRQACPYADYETYSVFGDKDEFAKKHGIQTTPTVTIRKYYYVNGDPAQKLGVEIATRITGAFTADDIDEQVRCIQGARTSIPRP